MLLFYVRHGDPIYEPDGLTPLGVRQAESVAKRLALYGVDEIYSSSSRRAVETATPTSEIVHKPITVLDWCNENILFDELVVRYADGHKDWLYRNAEIRRKFSSNDVLRLGDRWYTHDDFTNPLFKSGFERIKKNAYSFMRSLGFEHNNGTADYKSIAYNERRIVLFAHEGVGKALLSVLLDIPYPLFCTRFELCHSGITAIGFGNGNNVIPEVLSLSNDSHLYRDGLPTRYNNEIYF